jgi:hypothetical protein
MKHILLVVFFVFCFQDGLFSEEGSVPAERKSPLNVIVKKLEGQGYKMIAGPVQYIEKNKNQILFYRHKPVKYKRIRTIDAEENFKIIQKYDFVHVLSKEDNVVLIYSEKVKSDDVY